MHTTTAVNKEALKLLEFQFTVFTNIEEAA